jgi:hypothetical protein
MDEYEVMLHVSSENFWRLIPTPRFFNDLDEAKERCDKLNRREFGNVKGVADDYFGVIRKSDDVCVYPE